MKAEYKEIQKEADKLFHRTEAKVDDRDNGAAQRAMRAARNVRECIESDKGPRTIDDQIKRAIESLEDLKEHPDAMTPGDVGQLIEEYEDMRRECRKLPNF